MFGTTYGSNDVAIAQLAWSVPDVTPGYVSSSGPSNGTLVYTLGYGNTGFESGPDDCGWGDASSRSYELYYLHSHDRPASWKRIAHAEENWPASLCEGDSGGPSMFTSGGVFWVASDSELTCDPNTGMCDDVLNMYGEAWRKKSAITTQINAWHR